MNMRLSLIVIVLMLGVLVTQVFPVKTFIFNKEIESELKDEARLLFGGILVKKCNTILNQASEVLPSLSITLTKLSNDRLYYFSPIGTRVPFEAARTFCMDHGMHLVTINTERENFLVYSKGVELGLINANPGAWLGYRDVTGTNTYQWVQPGVGLTGTYFRGANNPGANECAVYLDPTGTNGYLLSWISRACDSLRAFVCELEPPCSLVL